MMTSYLCKRLAKKKEGNRNKCEVRLGGFEPEPSVNLAPAYKVVSCRLSA